MYFIKTKSFFLSDLSVIKVEVVLLQNNVHISSIQNNYFPLMTKKVFFMQDFIHSQLIKHHLGETVPANFLYNSSSQCVFSRNGDNINVHRFEYWDSAEQLSWKAL